MQLHSINEAKMRFRFDETYLNPISLVSETSLLLKGYSICQVNQEWVSLWIWIWIW